MFARKLEDLAGTDKDMVRRDGDKMLHARRLLTKADGCGFSLSDGLFSAGFSIDLHYKNHVEGNLIISGVIEVTDLTKGISWDLESGSLYMVGPRDRHRLTAKTDVHLASVFSPAVMGNERHDADGAFPPTGDIPPVWQGDAGRTMYVKRLEDIPVIVIGHGRANAYRYLTHDDGCGFTISTPRAPEGKGIVMWYQNHVEANYVLEGEGYVEDVTTGKKWDLAPGTVYVVGPRDRHQVTWFTDLWVMSIFNPPIYGDETHDDQGGYPPTGPIPEAYRP